MPEQVAASIRTTYTSTVANVVLEVYGGRVGGTQTLIYSFSLTPAQVTSLCTNITSAAIAGAATNGTVNEIDVAQNQAPIGVSNTI